MEWKALLHLWIFDIDTTPSPSFRDIPQNHKVFAKSLILD